MDPFPTNLIASHPEPLDLARVADYGGASEDGGRLAERLETPALPLNHSLDDSSASNCEAFGVSRHELETVARPEALQYVNAGVSE
jgi:hypothetical protein